MFPHNPKVLVDNKVLDSTKVHAVIVRTTREQPDTAEITVAGGVEAQPANRLGARVEVKLALGDTIFLGQVFGMAPSPGFREWVIRAQGNMRLAQPPRGNDARITQPIKSLQVSMGHPPYGGAGDKRLARATLTLDPEIDSVRFLLGDTKDVSAGPGRSFTGNIENIERVYRKFGGDRLTLMVVGWIYDSSTPPERRNVAITGGRLT